MKKSILLFFAVLLSNMSLLAQSPCFTTAFGEGQRLFKQGNYKQARKYFKDSKACPDPNTAAANEWIAKCDRAIAEAGKKKLEAEAAKSAYMNIRRIDYCNVDKYGQIIDNYGDTFYPSKMKCLQPRITYDALLDETREPVIYIKVKNPNKIMVSGKDSPSGYTYSSKVRVTPGKDKTVVLSTWDNNGLSFSKGTYSFELWYNGACIFTSSFKVEEDVKKDPQPPVVVAPSSPIEKKAEIKVSGKDGKPLQGAKLLLIGTGKYEMTNSEGIGRIDLSSGEPVKIEVSHTAYKDKKELWVHVGDEAKVTLYQSATQDKSDIGVIDYIIPGLAQMKTNRIGEGIVFMGGEAVLLASGFISNSMAGKQLKVMQNDNVTLPEYQSAHSKYNTQRVVNIVAFTSAGILYAAHLYRTYTISSSRHSNFTMAPTVMNMGDEMALGLNINLSF